jgi:hypothetical protein
MSDDEEKLTAVVDLLGRTGARSFELRYSDAPEPVVWIAVAEYLINDKVVVECAAGNQPHIAAIRLVELLIDGGQCTHCHRLTGVTEDFDSMPLNESVCWYQWDPEMKTFRRGCEGD